MTSVLQIFSGDTLRELDASAYEEAPPLSPGEIAQELGPTAEGAAPSPRYSSRSLGGRRGSLGTAVPVSFALPPCSAHCMLQQQACASVTQNTDAVNVLS